MWIFSICGSSSSAWQVHSALRLGWCCSGHTHSGKDNQGATTGRLAPGGTKLLLPKGNSLKERLPAPFPYSFVETLSWLLRWGALRQWDFVPSGFSPLEGVVLIHTIFSPFVRCGPGPLFSQLWGLSYKLTPLESHLWNLSLCSILLHLSGLTCVTSRSDVFLLNLGLGLWDHSFLGDPAAISQGHLW